MKAILIILLLSMVGGACAQVPDITRHTDTALWKDSTVAGTHTYLRAYNNGIAITTVGLIGTGLSAIAWAGAEDGKQMHTYAGLTLASGFVTLVGALITADAYCKLRKNRVYLKSAPRQISIGFTF